MQDRRVRQTITGSGRLLLNAQARLTVASCGVFFLMLAGCGGGGGGTHPASAASTDSSGAGNIAPVISGSPVTAILAGESYSFQPTADDADGDSLTFSAENIPAWASFDSRSGRLSGTPTAAEVGVYEQITISVSDGSATASLAQFSLTVAASGTGTASLNWVPPTTNSDGSVLVDLAGYRILYGRSSNNLNHSVAIENPSISTYLVENLTSGPWYFAVVAVNAAGFSSPLSNVASKTIT